MAEYISKQRAKDLMGCCLASVKAEYKAAKDEFTKARFGDYISSIQSMIDVVGAVEAADVQPILHGRWIDCTFYDPYERSYEQNFKYKCSCCGHMIYNKPNDDNLFCGHCSARMDGDTNE